MARKDLIVKTSGVNNLLRKRRSRRAESPLQRRANKTCLDCFVNFKARRNKEVFEYRLTLNFFFGGGSHVSGTSSISSAS